MNIIMGQSTAEELQDRYIVLELDRFQIPGCAEPVPSYCVIEDPALDDIMASQHLITSHADMMAHYRAQRWDQCLHHLAELRGAWQGQVDTFLDDLEQRVHQLRQQDLPQDWTGIRTSSAA